MRKKGCLIALILIAIIVVGCSNAEGNDNVTNDSTDKKVEEDTGTAAGDGPLIDSNNPHNEREEIMTLIEEQKELLKLGFVKEDTAAHDISTYRFIEKESDDVGYDIGYAANYRAENSDHSISLSPEPFICEDGLDEWSSDLDERKSFSDDRLEGYYGYDEYGSSYIFLEHNDICYSSFISGDDDIYDEKDKRLLELLTKTIKTEAEGAYDPFYTRFTMDLNKLKFPLLNQETTKLRSVRMAYSERTYDPSYSEVEVTYFIGEEVISYGVTDEVDPTKGIEFLEDMQTENGVTVSKYENTTIDREYYHWQDDGFTYSIDVGGYNREVTDEEVFEIIDSTMEDDRSFENLDFFQGVNDKANLDDHGLEILSDYYY